MTEEEYKKMQEEAERTQKYQQANLVIDNIDAFISRYNQEGLNTQFTNIEIKQAKKESYDSSGGNTWSIIPNNRTIQDSVKALVTRPDVIEKVNGTIIQFLENLKQMFKDYQKEL